MALAVRAQIDARRIAPENDLFKEFEDLRDVGATSLNTTARTRTYRLEGENSAQSSRDAERDHYGRATTTNHGSSLGGCRACACTCDR